MPALHPFPRFYHLPYGEADTLPVTRNGIRQLSPFPFFPTEQPGFGELRIARHANGRTVRGICGLLPARCFTDGTVRPHENTLRARMERQRNVVTADGGALGKPILLTVPSLADWWIRQDAAHRPATQELRFHGDDNDYRLRGYAPGPGSEPAPLPLRKLGPLVVADGHHRAFTHAQLDAEGVKGFEWLPVVIIGADELEIGSFLRVIDYERGDAAHLLTQLGAYFLINERERPLTVDRVGDWLLSYRGRHFHLRRRDTTVTDTDAGWLTDRVLPAVFGITDIRNDPRITSIDPPRPSGGAMKMPDLLHRKVKLCGFPLPPGRFFSEVAAGRVLPPKSTRFEPRVPSGLLVWMP